MSTLVTNSSLSSLLEDLYKRANVDWIPSEFEGIQSYRHYDKEKLVGFCILVYGNTICNLVVDKDYRRSGIASKLLKQAINDGANYLCSVKSNVRFYINRGFKVYQVEYDKYYKENLYYMIYKGE